MVYQVLAKPVIESILSAKTDPELLKGDIIRVLAIFKRLWSFEVVNEINSMRSSLGEGPVKDQDVVEAIKELLSLGVVRGETAKRTTFRGIVEDMLFDLSIGPEEIELINSDERMRLYMMKRYEAFGFSVKKDL